MQRCLIILGSGWLAVTAGTAESQTLLKLSTITPGTERVQLVANGDFQAPGPIIANRYPSPDGWSRQGDVFVGSGTNMVTANKGIVARGHVDQGAPVGLYQRTVSLLPNTEYVLSGYLWNMGNAANHVTAVFDLNDAPLEPQVTLSYSAPNADQGYFVCRYFNTTNTGTNVTVRAFYDGFIGAGTAPAYFPVAAQWDNVAITKAAEFALPQTNSVVPLQVLPSNNSVSLSWPALGIDLLPQSTSNLVAPILWKNVTNALVFSNNLNTLTLTNPDRQKFFRLVDAVDPSTLNRKLLMGYQGWFVCPQDGSQVNAWIHWFRSQTPIAANVTVDFWPDISELDEDELFATGMTLTNGSPARLYSAFTQKTVVRHFRWMKDNRLDGVFLQRFSSELSNPAFFALRNQVASNVRVGAETHSRVFAMMYDISGQPATSLVSTLTNDWNYLVNTMKLTSSPRYVRHNGKPVVAIWGFGFTDRPGTPQDAQTVINYFKSAGAIVMGGVPTYWRTLNNDSQNDPAWASVYRSFDIISPWAVGRYGTQAEADSFKQNLIVPDLADANSHGLGYMPVIFPGFSWHNLFNTSPPNQIPRLGGTFYWRQAYNAIGAGCTMIYGAMFDEVDEGTAMFKLAPTANELPVQGTFVPLNIDGQVLPSDWYLRLAGEAAGMLRGDRPLQPSMPITP